MPIAAERHARLNAVYGEAQAAYDALAVRVADKHAETEAALAVADMPTYDELSASLGTLRGELERQAARVTDIIRQRDLVNVERVREENLARLAEAEKSQAVAEQDVQRFAAEIVPLVEALREAIRGGKAAEDRVAAYRAEVHGLKMTLGHLPNGAYLDWTHRPIGEILMRNAGLDELNAYGVR
jgi:molecular chaperone GrpE (heat shock protein)